MFLRFHFLTEEVLLFRFQLASRRHAWLMLSWQADSKSIRHKPWNRRDSFHRNWYRFTSLHDYCSLPWTITVKNHIWVKLRDILKLLFCFTLSTNLLPFGVPYHSNAYGWDSRSIGLKCENDIQANILEFSPKNSYLELRRIYVMGTLWCAFDI